MLFLSLATTSATLPASSSSISSLAGPSSVGSSPCSGLARLTPACPSWSSPGPAIIAAGAERRAWSEHVIAPCAAGLFRDGAGKSAIQVI
jgi:hypothetical protein